VRPVIPALRTTSLAIENTYAKAIIFTVRFKSNANITRNLKLDAGNVNFEPACFSRFILRVSASRLLNHFPEFPEERRRVVRSG
jgi:hypothetical protein